MSDRLPIPTDNIYKFYALFGLVVLLTSAVMFFVRHDHYRTTAYENYMRIATLHEKEAMSTKDKLEVESLKSLSDVLKKDRDLELMIYSVSLSIGLILSIVGFYLWQTKVQPRQDELIDLQIEKLKKDLGGEESLP